MEKNKRRAPRNKTLTLYESDIEKYSKMLLKANFFGGEIPTNTIVNDSCENTVKYLKDQSIDLLFLDPPYNLNKSFNNHNFKKSDVNSYTEWFESWFKLIIPKLKKTSTIYVCGDWHTSLSIYSVLEKYSIIRNRITWEREKGRGAKTNYKNSHEDIWFATISNDYTFNVDAIKLKRKVMAPYRINGKPKDWNEEKHGNFRLTHPSNLWTDISVPFWSMPENTDHPTQKPEKLLAKLILASTNKYDLIYDPFLGSGTTAVVAKKLKRSYIGSEINEEYTIISLKRLEQADNNLNIQGYHNGVFWERNSIGEQQKYG